MAALGIGAITSAALLSTLIEEVPGTMLMVHRTAFARLRGATDESTISARGAAKAERTPDLIEKVPRLARPHP